jgi:broad specificity phosphatase PhoE
MPITRLLLLRHGEVEAAHQGLFGGRVDMDLSPLGHEQARALAEHLRRENIAAIYASPMKRVQQTIAPLLAESALRPVILPGLREMDFGEWTGRRWADIARESGQKSSQWLTLLATGAVNGAEDEKVLRARVAPCLQQIFLECHGQTVAVACHGGIVRMILGIALGQPLGEYGCYDVDYASVTVLELRGDRNILQSLNYTPWRNGK